MPRMIPLSVLDLSPIIEGGDASRAFANTLDLARHAEAWGFNRYWLAEHHNMTGIASAATAVVIGHVAGGTSKIRVGSGGIMLPNHAPLVIAEQFGTLEALYPGRIDLGLGRAPGTDQRTAQALRRTLQGDVNDFPRDVLEVQHYFSAVQPQSSDLDTRLKPVRCPTRRYARPALRLRLPFCARRIDAGNRALPRRIQAVATIGYALCDGGLQCLRR